MATNKMDTIGWYLASLHHTLGHRATARFLGMPEGDLADCILCRYERGEVTKAEVIERIGTSQ
jgi:hypothetical protein